MSVVLHYKDCVLGEIKPFLNEYSYSSLPGEKEAFEKYVGLFDYNLGGSVNRADEAVFEFFRVNFLENIRKREDILKKIGENGQNDYEILEKLSKLDFEETRYWLS